MVKIGIIGGSGLDNPEMLKDYKEIEVQTPYGAPSSKITFGKIKDTEVFILARHGKNHEITPTNINNRANIAALSMLGCKHILATSAAGSLREEIKPGDFVIPNQLIDFTKHRKNSFYDSFEKECVHLAFADPFSEELRKKLINECNNLGYNCHASGTTITIEGPRFSTRAESKIFRAWNADIIGMTTAPEASLAKEAGIEYACVSMATDYDCWKQGEEDVSFEIVLKRMKDNAERVKKLLVSVIENFERIYPVQEKMKDEEIIKNSIRTVPDFPKPGIMFRDITTLMKNPSAMKKVTDIFYERYKDKKINVVAGIESRGFIFGSILAHRLEAKFVPIRKKGKLPSEVEREEYALEYGIDSIEIHKDGISAGDRVLIIDDLIATSGTMNASANLIQKLGGKIEECVVIIELEDLQGRKKLEDKGYKLFSILKFKETEK